MKLLILLSLLMSGTAFGGYNLKSECFKEADKLDRDYCHGKKMKLFNAELNKDKKSWKKLTGKAKKKKTSKINKTIAERQAQLKMLTDELNSLKSHRGQLVNAKVYKPKKKKKKKDNNDLNKALKKMGIKL